MIALFILVETIFGGNYWNYFCSEPAENVLCKTYKNQRFNHDSARRRLKSSGPKR